MWLKTRDSVGYSLTLSPVTLSQVAHIADVAILELGADVFFSYNNRVFTLYSVYFYVT